ncbi:MAG: hypothetical protein H6538_07560, partial [Bacteroidales bacterium]|nr:hypothetical protein [Bacteroidales bacterium]
MKISGKIYLFIAILVFFAASCTKPASKSPGRKNLADIYNPAKNSLHPDFFINHLNDSNSVIYIRIYPSELLFSQANDEGKLMAKFRIQYE